MKLKTIKACLAKLLKILKEHYLLVKILVTSFKSKELLAELVREPKEH